MKLGKRVICSTLIALIAGALFPAVTSTAAPSRDRCWHYKARETSFAKKANAARSSRGIRKLKIDKQLSRVARKHTWAMARRRNLYHTPSNKLSRRVKHWRMLGENVGVGGDVRSLHVAFMNSPAHKANLLLGSFRYIGVGTKRKNGKLWVTVIFESADNPGTRLSMPRC